MRGSDARVRADGAAETSPASHDERRPIAEFGVGPKCPGHARMITVFGPFALLDDLKGPEAVIIRSPAQEWRGADAS